MRIIILSGRSGKRLWPLSNEIRSKQFLKIFKDPDGQYESMVQRIFRQIKNVDCNASITIATSRSQVSSIHNQLGELVDISVEPERRDTFPAIALAVAYLHDVKKVAEQEAVVVCPVDPYVDDSYFKCLKGLQEAASRGEKDLVLMGIQPTYPSEKYGYIIPSIAEDGNYYFSFKEKPTSETAKEYISQGALWNGGVFAFKLSYVLSKVQKMLGYSDYQSLYSKYSDMKNISFDYEVVERERNIEVLRYSGPWKDLGTWNTLTEAMGERSIGDVHFNDTCENVHAINELGIPMLIMGGKDLIVSASPDGIFVSDKVQSSYINSFVEEIHQEIMYAEKSWGSYLVLDIEERSRTIKVTLKANESMNYHSHDWRDEVWTVVSGQGKAILDGIEQKIGPGDVVKIPRGCKHIVYAETELVMIEVQIGENISVTDKQKYALASK